MPRVTVGMPTFKRADYLAHSIPLVLHQTFKDFELIICDDASPDSTADVVQRFKDPRIRYYRNPENLKIPRILNHILELATGELIIILHDHDIFHPELLERMVRFFDTHSHIGFVHPGVAWVDPDGGNYRELLCDFKGVTRGRDLAKAILMSKDFSCPITACSMVPRRAYEKVGFRYDEDFGFLSDMDLWLRLAIHYDVGYLREPLLTCRMRDAAHEYSGVNWQIIEWAVSIFCVNIQRHFESDSGTLQSAIKLWTQKRDRYYWQSILAAAAQADLPSFRKGLKISHAKSKIGLRFISKILLALYPCHPVLMYFGFKLSQGIKAFKRFVHSNAVATFF